MSKNNLTIALMAIFAVFVTSCSSESSVSCPKVKNGSFNTGPTALYVSFEGNGDANSYLVECGPTGFVQGTGTAQTTSSTSVDIPNLTPSTTYDVFVTSICNAEDRSQVYKMSSLTTSPSQCTGTVSLSVLQYTPTTIDLNCSYSGFAQQYDIEYGLHGFALGSGTKVSTSGTDTSVTVSVQPSTYYDFYIRAVCSGNDPSAYVKFEVTTTEQCPKPTNMSSYYLSGSCSSGSGETRGFSWSYLSGSPLNYEFRLVTTSGSLDTVFTTSNQGISISGISCSWTGFIVRAKCSDGSYSAWTQPFYW